MWEKLDTSGFVTRRNSFFKKKNPNILQLQKGRYLSIDASALFLSKKSTPYYTVHDLLINYAVLILSNYCPNFSEELIWICDETDCITHTAERSPPQSHGEKSMNPGRSVLLLRGAKRGLSLREMEKSLGCCELSPPPRLLSPFLLHVLKSVDLCKEAEPESIWLKPVRSQIQWTIDHQSLPRMGCFHFCSSGWNLPLFL